MRNKPIAVAIGFVSLLVFIRPSNIWQNYSDYFSQLNQMLRQRSARPLVFIDLDRLDHNISRVLKDLNGPERLRIVTKSLPSPDLLKYILKATGTNKLMVFHQPFARKICRWNEELDLLLGKPWLAETAAELLRACPSTRIQWLIDTPTRLARYARLAQKLNIVLSVNIEIDVGLHRGGVQTPAELRDLVQQIEADPGLRFAGLMGYDGHVSRAPLGGFENAHHRSQDAYQKFLAALPRVPPILNGGGSTTYQLHARGTVLNDISIGSAFLFPAAFRLPTIQGHRAASFIAAPALKIIANPAIPHLEFLSGLYRFWNVNTRFAHYLYGGGWPARIASPMGLQPHPLYGETQGENLVPNQNLLVGARKLEIGDFVFFHPKQADAIFQFEEIQTLRRGKLGKTWRRFQSGY